MLPQVIVSIVIMGTHKYIPKHTHTHSHIHARARAHLFTVVEGLVLDSVDLVDAVFIMCLYETICACNDQSISIHYVC